MAGLDLFGLLGNAFGGLTGALGNTTANIKTDVAVPTTPISFDQGTIGNLETFQNLGVDNFDFTDNGNVGFNTGLKPTAGSGINTTEMMKIGNDSFVPKPINTDLTTGLGGNSNNIKGNKVNPTAPGTEGTSSGIDWMDTVGVLGKLYEGYKNDKRADAAMNVQIKDRNNSRDRAKSVQSQMTGGSRPLAGSDYSYV